MPARRRRGGGKEGGGKEGGREEARKGAREEGRTEGECNSNKIYRDPHLAGGEKGFFGISESEPLASTASRIQYLTAITGFPSTVKRR